MPAITRIALISDTHLASRDALLIENWAAVERWIAAVAPDYVFHLGDITADGVHVDGELAHAAKLLARSKVPVHCLPGNHDIGDHPAGPGLVTRSPFDPKRFSEYRSMFGDGRWALDVSDWRLIGLNAQVLATNHAEEEAQFVWLAEVLRSHRGGPIGLFLHKPLFRDNADEDIVHVRYVPRAARLRLLDILKGHPLRFVAAGHTHQMRHLTANGVEHVWVPSTAFTFPDSYQERIGEKLVGIMLLEIEADAYRFTHVIPAGMVAHELTEFAHIYPELNKTPRSPPL